MLRLVQSLFNAPKSAVAITRWSDGPRPELDFDIDVLDPAYLWE